MIYVMSCLSINILRWVWMYKQLQTIYMLESCQTLVCVSYATAEGNIYPCLSASTSQTSPDRIQWSFTLASPEPWRCASPNVVFKSITFKFLKAYVSSVKPVCSHSCFRHHQWGCLCPGTQNVKMWAPLHLATSTQFLLGVWDTNKTK